MATQESHWFNQGIDYGSVPDYGAIFMSSTTTRKECFQRRLFGLPTTFIDFVMKVKAGMLLFLFDYSIRKLYGVFEASSDGTMNISSDAYKSSGKKFPAQVQFRIVWQCSPIPEDSFWDVIKENYFAPYKFHFGLSKDQVQKLLFLFEKRRVRSYKVNREVKFACQHDPVNAGPQNSIASEKNPSKDNPELGPEKPARMEISEDLVSNDPEDFIPLPSLDAAEIEALFSDGFEGEWDLDSLMGCYVDTGCLHENFDSSNVFPFLEEGESLLKQGSFPSKSQSSETKETCDQILNNSEHQVRGLYSDGLETRTSVFSCLTQNSKVALQQIESDVEGPEAGEILENKGDTEGYTVRAGVFSCLTQNSEAALGQTKTDDRGPAANILLGKKDDTVRTRVSSHHKHRTKIAAQENRIDSRGPTVDEILERLEQSYKKWKGKSRNCTKSKSRKCSKSSSSMGHDVFKTQRKRTSVFSRLKYRSMQGEGGNKVNESRIRNLNSLQHKDVQQRRVQRETEHHGHYNKSDYVHGSESDSGSKKQCKKRRLNRQLSDDRPFDLKTYICDSYSSVQVHGQENYEALGYSASGEGSSGSDTIEYGDSVDPKSVKLMQNVKQIKTWLTSKRNTFM